jgi:hypothetical protein
MTTWAIRQRSPLQFELCDDSWLVYAEASGRTHLVDFLSGEVLIFLGVAHREIEELSAFVAGQLGDPTVASATVIDEILQPLIRVGLVEQVQKLQPI